MAFASPLESITARVEETTFASGLGDKDDAGDVAPVDISPSPSMSPKCSSLAIFRDPQVPDADAAEDEDGDIDRDLGRFCACERGIAILPDCQGYQ